MVTGILTCDKPVICRVNGLRVGGGQEIGMACDFSIAQDLARFGQAGPKHGSAPDGGSTDFLHLFVGVERAMFSCTACEPWSAHRALHWGLLTDVVPALRVDGALVPNPLVETSRWLDEHTGKVVYGEYKTGAAYAEGKALLEKGTVDLGELDRAVEALATKMLNTFPECLAKTLESVRKKKLEHWDKNRETNRAWLALNMLTEAKAGFTAFEAGGTREIDFALLRRRLAQGATWEDPTLWQEIMPKGKQ
jgi:6-oxo-cyclohex-1-ene-carbonyl-CoA hydrolase